MGKMKMVVGNGWKPLRASLYLSCGYLHSTFLRTIKELESRLGLVVS